MGSNPTEGMDVHLFCLSCVAEVAASAASSPLVQKVVLSACLTVCDLDTSKMRQPWPKFVYCATEEKNILIL